MLTMDLEKLQYPIGKFKWSGDASALATQKNIDRIAMLPEKLSAIVQSLTPAQLETPYRPGGWTVRQVVHHVVDSHFNAIIRCKFALTEDNPTIKPYQEDRWALTGEYALPLETALDLLKGLHLRWTTLLRSLTEDQLKRAYFHPDSQRLVPLHEVIALYAWHGEHHLGHVNLVANAI